MKIPQRQDQVSLEAPRTAAGNVPEPTTAGLGNSYIKTMQGLSKSLQDISDLQFKLSMNATEAQIDRFNLYTAERTKQYEQELSLATTQEQIQNLFVNYKKDIDENGINTVGAELYSGWYSREGGQKVATAEYTGSLASAQLQIALNKQAVADAGRQYNELAFTANTPEEREKYVKEWEDMLGRYVTNGTISEAEKQNVQREWNLNFTRSLVTQDMDLNPEKTAEKLRKDKDYAPILTGEERLRLANEAMELAAKRKNTGKDRTVELGAEVWRSLYWSENEKTGKKDREQASKIYDIFANHQEQAKKILAKWLGKDEKEVSYENVEDVLAKMNATLDRENQDRQFEFMENLDTIKQNQNLLFQVKEMDEKDKNKVKSIYVPSGEKLYNAFLEGKLKETLSNPGQLTSLFKSYQNLTDTKEAKYYSKKNKKSYEDIFKRQQDIATLYVKGIRSDKEVLEDEEGEPWQAQMRGSFQSVFNAIDKTGAGTKELQESNMARFTSELWHIMEPEKLFDPNANFTEDETKKIVSAIEFAFVKSGLPSDYAILFFNATPAVKNQGTVRKILDGFRKSKPVEIEPFVPFSSGRYY